MQERARRTIQAIARAGKFDLIIEQARFLLSPSVDITDHARDESAEWRNASRWRPAAESTLADSVRRSAAGAGVLAGGRRHAAGSAGRAAGGGHLTKLSFLANSRICCTRRLPGGRNLADRRRSTPPGGRVSCPDDPYRISQPLRLVQPPRRSCWRRPMPAARVAAGAHCSRSSSPQRGIGAGAVVEARSVMGPRCWISVGGDLGAAARMAPIAGCIRARTVLSAV